MIVYICGSDSLLAKSAIGQIKAKYLAKNPGGAELVETDETTSDPNWADLQAVPLFATSRLVVIRRAGLLPKPAQQLLAAALKGLADSTVVVVWDGKKIEADELRDVLKIASKVIEVETPVGAALKRWIVKRAEELGAILNDQNLANLTEDRQGDLWSVEAEIRQLATGLNVSKKVAGPSEPFVFFNLVRRNDWAGIKQELKTKVDRGEPIELVMGSLAAAVRKEVKDKERARVLADLLLDVDMGLKTGFLEPATAVAVLASNLPQPKPNRVQWEQTWEEAYSGR